MMNLMTQHVMVGMATIKLCGMMISSDYDDFDSDVGSDSEIDGDLFI